jgi:hypothetical protein
MPKLVPANEKPENTLRIPSLWNQFRIFVARDLLSKWHNTQYLVVNLLQAPLLAFILAYIVRYYQVDELTEDGVYSFAENVNIPAFIFMSIIIALFMGLTNSAEEIIRDAKILKREAFLSLSRNSYLLSKVCILFSFSAFQAWIYMDISNRIVGIAGMATTYWIVYFTGFCFANMLGLNVSATFKSVVTIYILIPILLIPQLILGGIVVEFDKINPEINRPDEVPLIGDLMASRWAFEALAVSQFTSNPFEKGFYRMDKVMANAEYKRDYLIPTLSSKLEQAIGLLDGREAADNSTLSKNLRLLQSEILKELNAQPGIRLAATDRLKPGLFNFEVAQQIKQYLQVLRAHYVKVYNRAQHEKDDLTAHKTRGTEGLNAFLKAKENYQNEQIIRLVTNKAVEERIMEYRGRLIQKINPVYLDPTDLQHPLDYRAHFFAPAKHFLGYLIPTLYFNIAMIWLMSMLLYVTLYFKVFRKLVTGKYFKRRAFRFR